ncbi:hypothetical protein ACHAPT_009263 [Fusarium lateritium]
MLSQTEIQPRHPSPIGCQWVDELADKATQALLRDLERDTAAFTKQVQMIQLRRKRIYFCFDLFLSECSNETRADVSQSTEHLIHLISKVGRRGSYRVSRNKALETTCSLQLRDRQNWDKGERPFFDDMFTALVYHNGILVEDPEHGVGDDD